MLLVCIFVSRVFVRNHIYRQTRTPRYCLQLLFAEYLYLRISQLKLDVLFELLLQFFSRRLVLGNDIYEYIDPLAVAKTLA